MLLNVEDAATLCIVVKREKEFRVKIIHINKGKSEPLEKVTGHYIVHIANIAISLIKIIWYNLILSNNC